MTVPVEKLKMVEDVWDIVNRLFSSDAPVMKSQYVDSRRSNKLFMPEVQLWLDVFKSICVEWLEYKENPTPANFKIIKDLESWMYPSKTSNFPLERIAEALFLGFQIDMDIFKSKFRMWLRMNRPIKLKEDFELQEPMESIITEIDAII